MLFPEDPNKRSALWTSLAERLSTAPYCHVVQQGIGNPGAESMVCTPDEVAAILTRLRAADICRISASRGIAVAPHFCLRTESPQVACLYELITFPSDGLTTSSPDRLQQDLSAMAVCVFYDYPEVRELVVPLKLLPWQMSDAKIVATGGGLRITREALAR